MQPQKWDSFFLTDHCISDGSNVCLFFLQLDKRVNSFKLFRDDVTKWTAPLMDMDVRTFQSVLSKEENVHLQ